MALEEWNSPLADRAISMQLFTAVLPYISNLSQADHFFTHSLQFYIAFTEWSRATLTPCYMILTAMLVLFAVPAFYGLWLSTEREFMVLLFSFRPVVAYRALVVLCGFLAVSCTLWQLFCASSNSSCLYVRAAAYWLMFWFCEMIAVFMSSGHVVADLPARDCFISNNASLDHLVFHTHHWQ